MLARREVKEREGTSRRRRREEGVEGTTAKVKRARTKSQGALAQFPSPNSCNRYKHSIAII